MSVPRNIQAYRDDKRFSACPRAFLVTGKPENHQLNQYFIDKNQSGHWIFREDRGKKGDAIFILLPSASGNGGYPRELFGGVLKADPERESEFGRVLFHVKRFHRLALINAEIKRFLGGRMPPQGNLAISIWDDIQRPELSQPAPSMIDESGDEEKHYPEGTEKFFLHRKIERSNPAVKLAKAKRFKATGRLECEACGFDFAKVYGKDGVGFIEAHHRIPISSSKAPKRVGAKDFELVCSNCHRMLHRINPLMTAKELKDHLSEILKK
ncbi:hypothetical protein HH212_22855 [Massilia forsythiae]|uniref:HNH domain-containing protein n=1 Tax=Massilia forsythiae TaxID=2728020 RepID=A0A7Z2VZX1_9BURK|nr:HNH endonuclease [Massilia forsythiae]QJE02507.1 hypothetical protein HH212_22855 [Massilia forsythiae]